LRGRRFFYVSLLVVGFALSGSAGAAAYLAPVVAASIADTGHRGDLGAQNGGGAAVAKSGAPFTVLLLGSDDDAKFDRRHLPSERVYGG
jgi:hypothetical protein